MTDPLEALKAERIILLAEVATLEAYIRDTYPDEAEDILKHARDLGKKAMAQYLVENL